MNSNVLRTSSINGYNPSNVASSSSNPYPPTFQNQADYRSYPNNAPAQHRSQLMHQPSESQWSSQGHSNPAAYSHNTPHQQSWANQMQHNPYPNIMQGMNPMNFPFIPQQVIHDALAMSAPVEAADEPTLVQAILSSRNKGETYKDALNSLHGKNGHSASLWKDYYLEHKDRLDAWIAMCIEADAQKTTATTKKPVVAKPMSKSSESSPSLASKSPPASFTAKQKQKNRECDAMMPNPPNFPKGGRRTQNSLSAPTPVFDDRLPPPNTEVRVPPPPSRSPSPPRNIVPQGRGNKYTSEDRDFFIKFISWRLKSNPGLTRMDLCDQLAVKAPHHTSQSWASYWSNHHDLPDKILAAAHGEAYGSEDEDESESSSADDKDEIPLKCRPKYYESSLSSDEDRQSTSVEDAEDSAEDDENDVDDGPVRVYSESDMGSKGGPFTDADLYITAKYVTSFPDFERVTARERWDPYHELHPQRSAKAWAEYYRRYEQAIKQLAAKIRRQSGSIDSRRARPSWASNTSRWKRKHEEMEENSDDDGSKRSKGS